MRCIQTNILTYRKKADHMNKFLNTTTSSAKLNNNAMIHDKSFLRLKVFTQAHAEQTINQSISGETTPPTITISSTNHLLFRGLIQRS